MLCWLKRIGCLSPVCSVTVARTNQLSILIPKSGIQISTANRFQFVLTLEKLKMIPRVKKRQDSELLDPDLGWVFKFTELFPFLELRQKRLDEATRIDKWFWGGKQQIQLTVGPGSRQSIVASCRSQLYCHPPIHQNRGISTTASLSTAEVKVPPSEAMSLPWEPPWTRSGLSGKDGTAYRY